MGEESSRLRLPVLDALHLLPMLLAFVSLCVQLSQRAPAVHREDGGLLGDVATGQCTNLHVVLAYQVEAVVRLINCRTEEPGELLREYLLAVLEPEEGGRQVPWLQTVEPTPPPWQRVCWIENGRELLQEANVAMKQEELVLLLTSKVSAEREAVQLETADTSGFPDATHPHRYAVSGVEPFQLPCHRHKLPRPEEEPSTA